ncbi:MAG: deoxynucleotide monophosphate kinase [Cupriavidus sp.]|nr:deoxynucleotide monophosphate kinase [Cupriavidus sp.]
MTKLIGLYSPSAGSGKSTLAHALTGHGYMVERFAAPLKEMLGALLRHMGVSEFTIDAMINGAEKETPSPYLAGVSPRHALRTLGTEWGRGHISESLWRDAAMARAEMHRAEGRKVVFDDMRFPNEAAAIRERGGLLIKIARPGLEPQRGQHASEGGLDDWQFDAVIENTSHSAIAWALEGSAAVARAGG